MTVPTVFDSRGAFVPRAAGPAARFHPFHGRFMYVKPKLERFGTFRELTRVGFNGCSDGYTVTNDSTGVSDSGSELLGSCARS